MRIVFSFFILLMLVMLCSCVMENGSDSNTPYIGMTKSKHMNLGLYQETYELYLPDGWVAKTKELSSKPHGVYPEADELKSGKYEINVFMVTGGAPVLPLDNDNDYASKSHIVVYDQKNEWKYGLVSDSYLCIEGFFIEELKSTKKHELKNKELIKIVMKGHKSIGHGKFAEETEVEELLGLTIIHVDTSPKSQ